MEWLSKLKAEYKAGILLVSVMIVAALVAWYRDTPKVTPAAYTKPPPISSVSGVPKVPVVTKEIYVIPKKVAVSKIKHLPSEVADNESVEVLDTATTGPSEAGLDIVATLDKSTRKSSIFVKEKELPLIDFVNRGRVGVALGVSTDNGQQVGKVYGDWAFLRIGRAYLNAQAELRAKRDAPIEGIVSVGVDYRWQ